MIGLLIYLFILLLFLGTSIRKNDYRTEEEY